MTSTQLGIVEAADRVGFRSSGTAAGKSKRLAGNREILLAGGMSLVIFLCLWQLTGLFLNPIYFSTPYRVATAFGSIALHGGLLAAVGQTALVVVLGYGIAMVVGVSIGFLIGRYSVVRKTVSPLISMAIAAPFVALLPLMEIWFGLGTTSRVAFTFLLCIWMVIINTYMGVGSLSPAHKELADALGLSSLSAVRHVILPGASPYIYAGARIAAAQAIVGAVLAGQEVGHNGLGGLAANYGSFFQTPELIATIITSTILAFILFGAIRVTQRIRSPWIQAIGQG